MYSRLTFKVKRRSGRLNTRRNRQSNRREESIGEVSLDVGWVIRSSRVKGSSRSIVERRGREREKEQKVSERKLEWFEVRYWVEEKERRAQQRDCLRNSIRDCGNETECTRTENYWVCWIGVGATEDTALPPPPPPLYFVHFCFERTHTNPREAFAIWFGIIFFSGKLWHCASSPGVRGNSWRLGIA